MSETEARFSLLRKSADAQAVAALEKFVREATDVELNRINVIEFPAGVEHEEYLKRFVIDWAELGAGEKATMSLQLQEGFLIVFEPVTHAAHFLDVQGEPTRERQEFGVVFNNVFSPTGTAKLR